MKILALMTDAYGGTGGIAQHNRDLFDALSSMPEVEKIVSLPRLVPYETLAFPAKFAEHLGGKSIAQYILRALTLALREKPDVILCGHINLLPLGALIKNVLGGRLTIELHGIEVWSPNTSRHYDWCTRQLDMAISVSRFTRQKFIHWAAISPARVRVVPNAIHLDKYLPAMRPQYLQERYGLLGKKVLLTVARLSAGDSYKGQDRIIRLMKGFLNQWPNLIYLIAGKGDDRDRLERLANECGVADQVKFIGYVPENEMIDLYNLADAFAMPSIGEGFGFVFLEAAACGVPVLGGSVDGSPDALADGRIGIMVDPTDRVALNAGILRLLDRPRGVPTDLAMYDFDHFGRQIRQLILSMDNHANAIGSLRKVSREPPP